MDPYQKFYAGEDIAEAVTKATEMMNQGDPFEAKNLILEQVRNHPLAAGVAGALKVAGQCYLHLEYWHHLEVISLLVHRLRATAVLEVTPYDNLVNLMLACLNQKSYDEAERYGLMAEEMNPDDPDIIANMLVVETITGRQDPRLDRRGRLQRQWPDHLAQIQKELSGDGLFRPTHGEDASDLATRAKELIKHPPNQIPQLVNELCQDLAKRPDAKGAALAWREVAAFHMGVLSNPGDNEFVTLYSIASATAAAGKALMDNEYNNDAELWRWHGAGLGQLCLYDNAIDALEKSIALKPSDQVNRILTHVREMAALPETHIDRPDSVARWEHNREEVRNAGKSPQGPPAVDTPPTKPGPAKRTRQERRSEAALLLVPWLVATIGCAWAGYAWMYTSSPTLNAVVGGLAGFYFIGPLIGIKLVNKYRPKRSAASSTGRTPQPSGPEAVFRELLRTDSEAREVLIRIRTLDFRLEQHKLQGADFTDQTDRQVQEINRLTIELAAKAAQKFGGDMQDLANWLSHNAQRLTGGK